jgi:glycogen phosphorylase
MIRIRNFTVIPAIPEALARLRELAFNLWWTWNPDAIELFRRLDRDLWDEVHHNPVRLLAEVTQDQLAKAAQDPSYLAHMDRVLDDFYIYSGAHTWFSENLHDQFKGQIAYFSAEFGLHECLPIYSGGLGILSGDHLKSASDLGLPLVGVGLFYSQGYFHQFLTNDGWQFEDYPDLDRLHLPVTVVRDDNGEPQQVQVPLPGRTVTARIYKVLVGRVTLYLLDTDVPVNRPEDRAITKRLYGGDEEMRIRQEIVLGIGGLRALDQLGIEPAVFHMNEGHSAFLALEHLRNLVTKKGLTLAEAKEFVAACNVFTTHTPVPAGIDRFQPNLVETYLADYAKEIGLTPRDLLSLGRMNPTNLNEPFCMAVLALRLTRHSNGVSKMHGEVSRSMFQEVWPDIPHPEIPIRSVTNGVHVRSWLSYEMAHLFDRYLGPRWPDRPVDQSIWQHVDDIPDAELWRSHERLREQLVVECRRVLRRQLQRRGAPPAETASAEEVLDPEALTIGFARRFASYKRGNLFLRDRDRLTRILTNPDRPVQFVLAGKAHPRDNLGKEIIKQVVDFARGPSIRGRLVFLEDYDMAIARSLVQGVDVWLNTPIRFHEASGTSGMKVPPNGGINLSIMDGWWPEAYNGDNGWSIGDNRTYDNQEYQDFIEAVSLYDLLEKELIPTFYDRGPDGLPRKWIARMKASMKTVPPVFNTSRMVQEYAEQFYLPAAIFGNRLRENGFDLTRKLTTWKSRLIEHWPTVAVESVETLHNGEEMPVGHKLGVSATISLGTVRPSEVAVELFYGLLNIHGQIETGQSVEMTCQKQDGDGKYRYTGEIPCLASGQHGYAVRIVPRHDDMPGRHDLGLIRWG